MEDDGILADDSPRGPTAAELESQVVELSVTSLNFSKGDVSLSLQIPDGSTLKDLLNSLVGAIKAGESRMDKICAKQEDSTADMGEKMYSLIGKASEALERQMDDLMAQKVEAMQAAIDAAHNKVREELEDRAKSLEEMMVKLDLQLKTELEARIDAVAQDGSLLAGHLLEVQGSVTALAHDVQFQLNNLSQNITGYDENVEDLPLSIPLMPPPSLAPSASASNLMNRAAGLPNMPTPTPSVPVMVPGDAPVEGGAVEEGKAAEPPINRMELETRPSDVGDEDVTRISDVSDPALLDPSLDPLPPSSALPPPTVVPSAMPSFNSVFSLQDLVHVVVSPANRGLVRLGSIKNMNGGRRSVSASGLVLPDRPMNARQRWQDAIRKVRLQNRKRKNQTGVLRAKSIGGMGVMQRLEALEQQLYDEYNRTKKGFIDTNTRMLDMARELRESLSATSSFDRLGTKLDDAFGDLKTLQAELEAVRHELKVDVGNARGETNQVRKQLVQEVALLEEKLEHVNTRVNEIRDEMAKAKDDKISAAVDAALALEQLAELRGEVENNRSLLLHEIDLLGRKCSELENEGLRSLNDDISKARDDKDNLLRLRSDTVLENATESVAASERLMGEVKGLLDSEIANQQASQTSKTPWVHLLESEPQFRCLRQKLTSLEAEGLVTSQELALLRQELALELQGSVPRPLSIAGDRLQTLLHNTQLCWETLSRYDKMVSEGWQEAFEGRSGGRMTEELMAAVQRLETALQEKASESRLMELLSSELCGPKEQMEALQKELAGMHGPIKDRMDAFEAMVQEKIEDLQKDLDSDGRLERLVSDLVGLQIQRLELQEAGKSSNNAQEELQKVEADFRMLASQVQELFDIKLDRSEFQKMWDRTRNSETMDREEMLAALDVKADKAELELKADMLSTAISQKAEGQALGDIEAVLRRFGTELEALRHSSDDNLAKLRSQLEHSVKAAMVESLCKSSTVLATTKALRTCLSCERPAPEPNGTRAGFAVGNSFHPKLVRTNWQPDVYRGGFRMPLKNYPTIARHNDYGRLYKPKTVSVVSAMLAPIDHYDARRRSSTAQAIPGYQALRRPNSVYASGGGNASMGDRENEGRPNTVGSDLNRSGGHNAPLTKPYLKPGWLQVHGRRNVAANNTRFSYGSAPPSSGISASASVESISNKVNALNRRIIKQYGVKM